MSTNIPRRPTSEAREGKKMAPELTLGARGLLGPCRQKRWTAESYRITSVTSALSLDA